MVVCVTLLLMQRQDIIATQLKAYDIKQNRTCHMSDSRHTVTIYDQWCASKTRHKIKQNTRQHKGILSTMRRRMLTWYAWSYNKVECPDMTSSNVQGKGDGPNWALGSEDGHDSVVVEGHAIQDRRRWRQILWSSS